MIQFNLGERSVFNNLGLKMFWTILISFFVFLQTSYANVKVSEADIGIKENFLNELRAEIEENECSKTNENFNHKEINEYLEDIDSAKKALKFIEIEQKKGKNRNKKLLQDLVDDFNKKMEGLKKSYQAIKTRAKNELEKANFSKRGGFDSIDSLNWNKKKKQLKTESEFSDLELVENNDQGLAKNHKVDSDLDDLEPIKTPGCDSAPNHIKNSESSENNRNILER